MRRLRVGVVGASICSLTSLATAVDTTVYSTSFELPNFVPGTLAEAGLAGQNQWRVEYGDPANVLIASGTARTGTQALRIVADRFEPGGGWAWYDPIQVSPLANGTPLVTVQFSMRVASGTIVSDGFGMDVFSTSLNPMGRFLVGSDNRLRVQQAGAPTMTDTGFTVARNTWHTYQMVFDFITNKYDVSLNGTVVANDFDFTPDTGVIGDFDFRHLQDSVANDGAWFDDFSVVVGGELPSGGEWNVDANGTWNAGGNWSTGFIPNGVSATAKLGTRITAPRQVNIDSGVTMDQLQITSPVPYTVAGLPPSGYGLRFAGSQPVALQVAAGSHNFATNVKFDKDATIGIFAGATVRFSGTLDVTGRNVTKDGGGAMFVSNIRANSLNVAQGRIDLTGTGVEGGPMVVGLLNMGLGTLDLHNHRLIIDYTAGSPIGLLRQFLGAGRLLDSDRPAGLMLGYGENSALGLTNLEGVPLDDTSLIMVYALPGDANLDRRVNIDDFAVFSGGFNSQANWPRGDFNYDGIVNIDDFGVLAANFNRVLPSEALRGPGTVPEPSTAGITVLALTGRLGRRSRPPAVAVR